MSMRMINGTGLQGSATAVRVNRLLPLFYYSGWRREGWGLASESIKSHLGLHADDRTLAQNYKFRNGLLNRSKVILTALTEVEMKEVENDFHIGVDPYHPGALGVRRIGSRKSWRLYLTSRSGYEFFSASSGRLGKRLPGWLKKNMGFCLSTASDDFIVTISQELPFRFIAKHANNYITRAQVDMYTMFSVGWIVIDNFWILLKRNFFFKAKGNNFTDLTG